ncbi:MAG TPA: hypothetical protein VGJ33_01990 [Candidatus Angelobacter sp.]|jgi:hypothetical protein
MSYSLLENALVSLLKSLPTGLLARIQLSSRAKAIAIVLSVLLITFLLGWAAFSTAHEYLPLAALGVFYGVILSYPATKVLGPRLQSALGGLLGGISLGNVSSKVATGTSAIRALSKFINNTVQQVIIVVPDPKAQTLEDGIVLCIWMSLVTMFLIIATNAYLGDRPIAAVAPAAGPALASASENKIMGKTAGI